LVTIILLGLMFYQLWSRSNHFETFNKISFAHVGWWIGIVILLMPVNWGLEAAKWNTFLSVHIRIPAKQLMKAVAGGVTLSIFTPNRIGEYGGRILFMPPEARWQAGISTLMGSLSQNLVAVTAGLISSIFLFDGMIYLKILAIILDLIAWICFFRMRLVVQLLSTFKIHKLLDKLVEKLSSIDDYSLKTIFRALGIACCRYLVYTFQFILLLHAFEPTIHPGILFLGVSSVYLFQAIVPLPPVADVLARTNVGLIIWSGTGMSELSITLASLMVWLINLLIPAIIGSFLLGTIPRLKALDTHDQFVPSDYKPFIADKPSDS
jgi:hypothetical protein